jgi:hypothetical protein
VAHQFVGNDCGTRFGVLKAKVAHEQTSWFGCGRQSVTKRIAFGRMIRLIRPWLVITFLVVQRRKRLS